MQSIKIVRASQKYAQTYCNTMDLVAREGKFLSVSKGYPIDEIRLFIKICRQSGYPQFFLINELNEAVGWCDIVCRRDIPLNIGFMGIGIRMEYRNMGWGYKLIDATVKQALSKGFDEIRLEVRISNENAIHTYQKYGFKLIERIKDGVTTDGVSEDVLLMSYKPDTPVKKSPLQKFKDFLQLQK